MKSTLTGAMKSKQCISIWRLISLELVPFSRLTQSSVVSIERGFPGSRSLRYWAATCHILLHFLNILKVLFLSSAIWYLERGINARCKGMLLRYWDMVIVVCGECCPWSKTAIQAMVINGTSVGCRDSHTLQTFLPRNATKTEVSDSVITRYVCATEYKRSLWQEATLRTLAPLP